MTYLLEREIQGTLNLAILLYAKRFPEQRFEPSDVYFTADLDEDAIRERSYGRLEGMLLALGLDPTNPIVALDLHQDIKTARLFLERCPESLSEAE